MVEVVVDVVVVEGFIAGMMIGFTLTVDVDVVDEFVGADVVERLVLLLAAGIDVPAGADGTIALVDVDVNVVFGTIPLPLPPDVLDPVVVGDGAVVDGAEVGTIVDG
ncbi:MAG TPA: hypothetical protein VF803_00855 [Candidatus Paceibacterota bacterium]